MPLNLVFKRNPTGHPTKTSLNALDRLNERARLYFYKFLDVKQANALWNAGQRVADLKERTLFYTQAVLNVEQSLGSESAVGRLRDFEIYKWKPVGIEEFICSKEYLHKEIEIYPAVLECAINCNNGDYVEAVLTGGIGSGKTTLALYTNAYQLYLLSCMRSPHKVFGLDPSSEIIFIFQSITKSLAMGVDYQRFRSMIGGSPYFQKHYAFDKNLQSKMVFENRVEVMPVSGAETAAIGQNVIGGLIDELNYMAVIEKSRASVDKGATYDQAIMVYNSISRRRKSRFMDNGTIPGILCLVSSKRYPGQFTDQKIKEAENDPTIYVYDKRVWDIKPEMFGKKGWISIFSGDMTRKPRILLDDETVADKDRGLVVSVPEEFRTDFTKDVINALREIAGVSTLARHPFFIEVPKVAAAFQTYPSIFSQSPVDFVEKRLTLIKASFHQPDLPRFAHIDLGLTGDSAGLAIGTVDDFVEIYHDPEGLNNLFMPHIHIDGTLEIKPPKGGEILLSKVRDILMALKKMGLLVRWVTFDQFQSADSKQILQQAGFMTGQQSMDELPCRAYDFLKSAIYESRLSVPAHPHLQRELLMLEKDQKTGRVDHVPGGSKDVSDALAGVVIGLTMRREIWGLHRVPIMQAPPGILGVPDKLKKVEDQPKFQEIA